MATGNGGGGGRTVLFVDDEQGVLAAMQRLFRDTDLKLLFASSGAEALALLDTASVDAVVCDLQMPGMNGISVCEQVKARRPRVPCLMLSAYVEEESLERALAEDCTDGILIKPWDRDELRQAVFAALGD